MSSYILASTKPQAGWVSPALIDDRLEAEFYNPDYVALDIQLENSGLPIDTLGNISKTFTGPFGSNLPSSLYRQSGIPLLRVQNIGDFGINWDNLVFLDQPTHKQLGDSRLITGDLALAKSGSFGKIAPIWPAYGECNITEHILGIRVTDSKIDPIFLATFLVSSYGLSQIKRKALGTILKYLGVQVSRSIKIPRADPNIQAYIGDKVRLAEKCREEANRLYETSEKILSNGIGLENISSTFLEDSSKVLYEHDGSFAVQIEPKIATDRLDAQGYHPELLSLLSKLSKAKCKFVPLDYLGCFAPASQGTINGQSSDYFVSILHVDDTGVIDWQEAKQHKPITRGLRVLQGDILISRLNPKEKRICVFNCKEPIQAGCSSEFSVFKAYKHPYYLAFVLSSYPTHRQLVYLGRGTSSSRRRIDEQDLKNVFVPVIDSKETIDKNIHQAILLWQKSRELVSQAIMDIEDLIKGTLKTSAILSGLLHSPNWEEILTEVNHHA